MNIEGQQHDGSILAYHAILSIRQCSSVSSQRDLQHELFVRQGRIKQGPFFFRIAQSSITLQTKRIGKESCAADQYFPCIKALQGISYTCVPKVLLWLKQEQHGSSTSMHIIWLYPKEEASSKMGKYRRGKRRKHRSNLIPNYESHFLFLCYGNTSLLFLEQ